jgi:hypothetical protein
LTPDSACGIFFCDRKHGSQAQKGDFLSRREKNSFCPSNSATRKENDPLGRFRPGDDELSGVHRRKHIPIPDKGLVTVRYPSNSREGEYHEEN